MSARDITILGCSSQQPTRFRNHGAYLVRWNNEGLLFDPGEGTQRQFIFANIAPPVVTRIFISHFHGDHCLGLGSMLMRLNLDKVTHPIHCYYPSSGKKNFDRLRYSCIYHEQITVVEHPVKEAGLVENDGKFKIEAVFLEHGVDNIGWRVTEPDSIKFHKDELAKRGIFGPSVGILAREGKIKMKETWTDLSQVSHIRRGDSIAYVVDTRICPQAIQIAHGAKILISESTYLDCHRDRAYRHMHMTAIQAAELARDAEVELLILTHFSARYSDLEELGREARTIFPNTVVAEDLKSFPFLKE